MVAVEKLRGVSRSVLDWFRVQASLASAWIRGDAYACRLTELEEKVSNEIDDLLSQMHVRDLESVLQTLRERRSQLPIQPEFTPEVVGISKQILAFGAAGIGLVVAFAPRLTELSDVWLKSLSIVGLVYLNLMVSSLLVLGWFFIQARSRYPFLFLRKLGNTIPLFYYETLDRETRWKPVYGNHHLLKANEAYVRSLKSFIEYSLGEDLRKRTRNELQQYFLLIVYQGYLDQYELQLVNLFLYTTFSGLASVFILAFWL